MSKHSRRAAATAVAAGCALAAACAPATAPAVSVAPRVIGSAQHPSLAAAIAHGRDLGALPGSTVLHLTLGLKSRDPRGLAAALASGPRVSAVDYAARFGPDGAQVMQARATLFAAGIATEWIAGAMTMSASGSASSVDHFFHVRVDSRVGPDGVHFYAPASRARIATSLAAVVNAVAGLDNYPSVHASAIRSADGVSPQDMARFYNVSPLISAQLDGSGMTVVLIEIDRFDQRMLDAYAQKFNLPPFGVTVRQNSAAWGNPVAEAGEADLDLEIVHAMAPAAKEIVYYASPQGTKSDLAAQAAFNAYPQGAILSESLGTCETPDEQDEANLVNDTTIKAAAQGWSIFIATGDRGAYGCLPDGDANTLSTNVLSSVPNVTAVGGTYALLSSTGAFFKEAAWGEPIEQWGSGGGLSMFWPLPSWQATPGLHNQYSNGMRQNPDVSANADGESGWDIFANGQEGPVGGTSAAAPFWAAITALIDQDLKAKNLAQIGFANPALYTFAQNPPGLPSPPFHDVTVGTNLYYPATPGWDFATGLGTPDVAALAADFEWFERTHAGT